MLKEITENILSVAKDLPRTPQIHLTVPYPWKRPHHVTIVWKGLHFICRAREKPTTDTLVYQVLIHATPNLFQEGLPRDEVRSCFVPDFAARVENINGVALDYYASMAQLPLDVLTAFLGKDMALMAKRGNPLKTPPTRIDRNSPKVGFPLGDRWGYLGMQNAVQIKDYLFFTPGSSLMDRVGVLVLPNGLQEVSGSQLSRNYVKLREPTVVDLPVITTEAGHFREQMMEDLLYSLGG